MSDLKKSETNQVCELCGLAVEMQGFKLITNEGTKIFCCEGCKGIYQMLNEELILPSEQQ